MGFFVGLHEGNAEGLNEGFDEGDKLGITVLGTILLGETEVG